MSKTVIQAGWDHAPHLTPAAIADMAQAFPPHELEARRNGIPTLGAGKIYPLDEGEFRVPDFPIPDHFKRVFGMDVGFNRTAAIWLALDPDADIAYAYSEHYAGEAIPAVHAEAIKARGPIPGAIDPASHGRSQVDGQQLIAIYRGLGLDLQDAENAVSAGIYAVWQRLVSGQLKVFGSLGNLLGEMKLYRRDEKGRIVKKNDHACDALRYGVMGLGLAKFMAPKRAPFAHLRHGSNKFAG